MTEHCKLCAHATFNPERGIICGLTDFKPKFKEYCQDYQEDPDAKYFISKLLEEADDPSFRKSTLLFQLFFKVISGVIMTLISIILAAGASGIGLLYITFIISLTGVGIKFIAAGVSSYHRLTNKRKYVESRLQKHLLPFDYYRNK